MPDRENFKRELEELREENERQRERIDRLENKLSGSSSEGEEQVQDNQIDSEIAESSGNSFEVENALKWLGRVGILAVLLGFGFFIKYAIDNNWIGYLGRITIGVLSGAILVAGGQAIRRFKNYIRMSNLLTGGGIALAYFSVYASYHFESYRQALGTSWIITLVLLTTVVAAGAAISLFRENRNILSLTIILGFITSFLSAEFQTITLAYILILSLGLVLIASYKYWDKVPVLGLVFTYTIFGVWYFQNTEMFWVNTGFLIGYAFIYAMMSWIGGIRNPESIYNELIYVVNALIFYTFFILNLNNYNPNFNWLGSVAIALGYYISFLTFKSTEADRLKRYGFYIATLALFLAVPMKFEGGATTVLWAVGTIMLTLVSTRLRGKTIRYTTYGVGILTALKIILVDSSQLSLAGAVNIDLLGYLIGISALYLVYILLYKNKDKARGFSVPVIFSALASIAFALLIGLRYNGLPVSVLWALFALAILVAGIISNRKHLRLEAITVFVITIGKVFLIDTSSLDTVGRTISMLVLGLILLIASFGYLKYQDSLKKVI